MEWEISNDFTESVIGHDGYLKMNMITTLMLHAHASQALLLMLLLKLTIACLFPPLSPGGVTAEMSTGSPSMVHCDVPESKVQGQTAKV